YLFARDLFGDRTIALFSLVLYLFVPAKLFFFPLLNTFTPVVVLACACLSIRWLRTGRVADAALFGVALYGLVFYEPLPLVMGVLFTALAGRAILRRDLHWQTCVLQTAVVGIGFALAHATMIAWFGFDIVSVFRQIAADAVAFNASAARP